MLIAVPSDAPGGLEAPVSAHFGHCHTFTLVQVDDGRIGNVNLLQNQGHEQGGCLVPVTLLEQNGVQALVAGGMGARPLAGFQPGLRTGPDMWRARRPRRSRPLLDDGLKSPENGQETSDQKSRLFG